MIKNTLAKEFDSKYKKKSEDFKFGFGNKIHKTSSKNQKEERDNKNEKGKIQGQEKEKDKDKDKGKDAQLNNIKDSFQTIDNINAIISKDLIPEENIKISSASKNLNDLNFIKPNAENLNKKTKRKQKPSKKDKKQSPHKDSLKSTEEDELLNRYIEQVKFETHSLSKNKTTQQSGPKFQSLKDPELSISEIRQLKFGNGLNVSCIGPSRKKTKDWLSSNKLPSDINHNATKHLIRSNSENKSISSAQEQNDYVNSPFNFSFNYDKY